MTNPNTFVLGAVVPLTFEVCDEDGAPANAGAAALLVTKPSGSTDAPVLLNPQTGRYTFDYLPAAVGRYVAVAAFTGVNAGTAVDVWDVVATTLSVVALAEVKSYLGDTSWPDTEIQRALDAERAAQAKACLIDVYGPDLREALLRRVARNLAARAVPVATFTSFEGGGTSARVPRQDAEIVRLEGPYARWSVG